MEKFLKETDKARNKLKKGPEDTTLSQKPFADGLYRFSMFMIDYYSRARKEIKIDYDSFIIIQTTVSHSLYYLKKKEKRNFNYEDLEIEWDKLIKAKEQALEIAEYNTSKKPNFKLTMSSICLVTGLPKETVRRKTKELIKRNLLKISKTEGVILGSKYSNIFRAFVPETVLQLSKLLKDWEKIGAIKNILSFKI